jgi:hypothetical protein
MPSYRVELSESAADGYRNLELFERQRIYDPFESFRDGQNLEGDYSESLSTGQPLQVIVVSQTAVSFVIHRETRLVRVLVIAAADE